MEFYLLMWLLMFLGGLLFLLIAARLVTRVVLDEIAKDRERRAKA
jgi:hypothetical protein